MTQERWQEVKKVLAAALERAPGERNAYLDQACGEPDLRREVESLIAAHEQAQTSFLAQPAIRAKELAIGSRLGPYEILARIGAGGMGEVYRARDTKLGRAWRSRFCRRRCATIPSASRASIAKPDARFPQSPAHRHAPLG